MNKMKLMMASLIASFAIIAVPTAVSAGSAYVGSVNAKNAICQGVSTADGGGGGACPAGETNIGDIVKLVINILSLVAGIIAVIMMIVGGLKYITSSGDPSSITSAKNTIIYAVVGIIVVAFSQLLVRFVFFRVSE